MKRNAVLTALLVLPLLTAACNDRNGKMVIVEVSCEDFATSLVKRNVTVETGATVIVRLCCNPSTGFEWEDAEITSPFVLKERAREFLPPDVPMPGSAGVEQWTFEALSAGTSIISMEYSRPWEGGEKGIWSFELEVWVE